MLSLNGKASDADAFLFFLATQLGRTVTELDVMPHSEYVQWAAYFKSKNAIENQRRIL